MRGSFTPEFFEELAIVLALICTQFVYAVYAVFTSHLMSIGLTPIFLAICGSFSISCFLFPLAVGFERKLWPQDISLKLVGQLVLLSFGGVTLFQVLILHGVQKTSPAVATAMPNLAPGFIFIIAWVFRLERVDMKSMYGALKVIGTIVCTIGAISMSLLHDNSAAMSNDTQLTANQERLIGTICLLGAVIILSCTIVLQAVTLGDFPAPISLSALTAFIGAILTAIVQLMKTGTLEIGTPLVSGRDLVFYMIMGGAVNGTCTSFQTWAMKKKGPVFVSTFNPIGTVFSVILSAVTLGDSITAGSMCGMLLMFGGLYCVLWAKRREHHVKDDDDALKVGGETRPLLS